MNKFLLGWILGLAAGSVLVMVLWGYLLVRPMAEREQALTNLLNKCQENLPRSQKCELVAVPLINK